MENTTDNRPMTTPDIPTAPPAPRPEGDWFAVAMIAQDMRSRGLADQACGDELLKLANGNRSHPAAAAAVAAAATGAAAAAALRAAADQAHPKAHIEDIAYAHQTYVDGWKDALDVILAIAAELEAQP